MSDLTIELLEWQKKVWVDPTRFIVCAAGRPLQDSLSVQQVDVVARVA